MKWLSKSIAFKSIAGVVLLLAVFSAIVIGIGYHEFTEVLLDQYEEGAFRTADAAALTLDPDMMEAYLESGGTSVAYRLARDSLNKLCNASGATFIYVILPDLTDYGHITFVFSTVKRRSGYSPFEVGYVRETTNDDYRQKYRALFAGEMDRALVLRDRGHIETEAHITAMVPLKGVDHQTKAILCVQRQMDALSEARTDYVRKVILALLGLAALVAFGLGLYLHRMLLMPVKRITTEASRFAAENVPGEEKLAVAIRNRDEIGLLAGAIDQMEEQTASYMEEMTRITAEKEHFRTELTLATRIQAAMLPSAFPPFPERSEFDIYASMDPAKEVGGDFYDFALIDDDHLYLAIADVSGKGIPAALFMMASKIILANNAKMNKSPAEILANTNAAICSNNREEMFVTAWVGILEISTGRLTAANAGHEYPVLLKAGGRFELLKDRHGFVIGGMPGMKYTEYELQLEPGAKLFLYTDGVPEATNARDEMFGTARLLAALNEEADAAPERVLRNVRRAVDGFVQDAEQFDDMTLLCMEFTGKGRREEARRAGEPT